MRTLDERTPMKKKLRRVPEKACLGGVCAGIAYRYELPLWFVRSLFVLIPLALGAPSIFFMLLWSAFCIFLYTFVYRFIPAWEHTPEDFEERTKR